MTDSDRRLLSEKCGQFLHSVLVEIRMLSYQEGNARQINELTDLTHNVPLFMVGCDDYAAGYLRDGLLDYARKYYPDTAPEHHRYVVLFDMDEAAFAQQYRRSGWAWPEPELSPAAG